MRDRATLYLAELGGKAGGVEAVEVQWDVPARNLEKSLRTYLDNGGEAPFSLVRPGRGDGWADGKPVLLMGSRQQPAHRLTQACSACRLAPALTTCCDACCDALQTMKRTRAVSNFWKKS